MTRDNGRMACGIAVTLGLVFAAAPALAQEMMANITVALNAGAAAVRMRFSAFLWFVAGWLLFVCVPIAHWVWGGGFLASAGVLDFAGGTVVRLNAGVAGLVAAYELGKRHGYGTDNFAPHDLSLAGVGTGLLLVGWIGLKRGPGPRRPSARRRCIHLT